MKSFLYTSITAISLLGLVSCESTSVSSPGSSSNITNQESKSYRVQFVDEGFSGAIKKPNDGPLLSGTITLNTPLSGGESSTGTYTLKADPSKIKEAGGDLSAMLVEKHPTGSVRVTVNGSQTTLTIQTPKGEKIAQVRGVVVSNSLRGRWTHKGEDTGHAVIQP